MSDPQPKWRKVLVSGSNAHVAALTASAIVNTHGDAQSPGVEEQVLVYNTSSGAFYYTGSFGTGGSGGGTPASPNQSVQFNNSNAFGGDSGFIFDSSQDASLFVDGPITGSNISGSGVISGSEVVALKLIAQDTDNSATIALKDADGNSVAQFARVGSGVSAHMGRMVLRDNANIKTQFTAGTSPNFISNGSNNAKLGINVETPGQELTVQGNVSASGNLFASTTLSASHASNNVLLINTSTGELYHTGSYGSGGGSGITGVTAGDGLSGGGSSGAVTINVDYASTTNIITQAPNDGSSFDDTDKIIRYSDGDEQVQNTTIANFKSGYNLVSNGDTSLFINGSITGSNISASAITFTKHLQLPTTSTPTNGGISFGSPGGDNGFLIDSGDFLHLGYNDNNILTIHDTGTNVGITGSLELISDATMGPGHITASGNISASGALFASTSLSASHAPNNVVLINTATGELYHTGSYGSGGSGGGAVTAITNNTNDNILTATGGTTINGEAALTFNTSNGLRVAQDAQLGYLQNGIFGGNPQATSYKAGQFLESSQLRTYVTPQKNTQRMGILGVALDRNGRVSTTANYIRFTSSLFFDPTTGGDGGHGGTGDDGTLGTIGRMQVADENEKTGITISGNPGIFFFNNDASASVSGSFNFDSASAHIKFDTGSSGVQFLTGETTQTLTQTLFLSQSSGNPSIGIGTTTPLSTLDVRSVTSSAPANIVLRTNEDGVIEVGEETGRIEFAIESASYLGTSFVASGSTAAMFSRVVESSPVGAIGNLIFTVNKSLATATTPLEAVTIGKGASASSTTEIGMAVSGNIDLVSTAPRLTVKNSNGNEIAHLGFHSPTDFSDGQLLLFNQGAQSVKLNGDQSPADASFIQFGNFALGGTTAGERLTVEGNISSSGTITMLTASIGGGIFTSASLAGAIASAGDITGVTAGSGLSGGGSSGAVTINVDYGSGTIITDAGAFNTGGTSVTNDLLLVHHNDDGEAQKVGITAFMDEYKIVNRTGTPVDNDYAKFTDANTIEGRSFSEVKTDLSLGNVTNESKATMFTSPTFTGNVTASGNISASGTIFATRIHPNDPSGPYLDEVSSRLQASSGFKATTELVAGTNITASGNISASGDLEFRDRKLSKTSTTDADHQGDVVFFGSTTSMTAGTIYYYNSSGNWASTDADAEATADGLLAVALGTASDTDGMLLKGMVTLNHDAGTVGDPLFLSTSAGRAQSTAPSGANDIVRLIGYCLDSTNGQIYFNPSNDFIKHA